MHKQEYSTWIASGKGDFSESLRRSSDIISRLAVVHEAVEDMAREFPELKVQHGVFESTIDGQHEHWWLVTEDGNIVDPYLNHWKNGGVTGHYLPTGNLSVDQLRIKLQHGYRVTGVLPDNSRHVVCQGVSLKAAERQKDALDNGKQYVRTVIDTEIP